MKAFSKVFLVFILCLGLICTVVACTDDNNTEDPAGSVADSGEAGESGDNGENVDNGGNEGNDGNESDGGDNGGNGEDNDDSKWNMGVDTEKYGALIPVNP